MVSVAASDRSVAFSTDMAADEGTEEVEGDAAPTDLTTKAVRGAERWIKDPYLLRKDVGTLSFLVGNWAGHRQKKELDEHQIRDMR